MSPGRSGTRCTPTPTTPPTGRRAGSSRWWATADWAASRAAASTTIWTRYETQLGGVAAALAGQVPDHVRLRDPLAARDRGHIAPRELRLRQVVPARQLYRLQRAAERGAEVIL